MADFRRFDVPRAVDVLFEGQWWPGLQSGWVRWPDGSWRAEVEFIAAYDWGPGKHMRSVPADCIRLRE